MKTYKKIITIAVVLLMAAATMINIVLLFGCLHQFVCYVFNVNYFHKLPLEEIVLYFIVSCSGLLTTFLYFKKLMK